MWATAQELYKEYIIKYEDPRVANFPIMDSPKVSLVLVGLYLAFVKIFGPMYMKNRPPMNIKNIIVAYNAFMTIFSFVMFVLATYYALKSDFNITCQVQDHSKRDYYSLRLIQVSWMFFFGRFFEFADTIFFILRKKNSQVSTLHVVHHALVPLICWIGVKVEPGGHYNFAGYLNAVVHTFMYLYYMLASMGPAYRKHLWWKKHMTKLQLTQFVIVIIHTVWTLYSGCNATRIFGYLILFQAIFFYKMFWDFYKENFSTQGQKVHKKLWSFNLDKFNEKYKKYLEVCIPNQQILLSDSNEDISSNGDDKNTIYNENGGKLHIQ